MCVLILEWKREGVIDGDRGEEVSQYHNMWRISMKTLGYTIRKTCTHTEDLLPCWANTTVFCLWFMLILRDYVRIIIFVLQYVIGIWLCREWNKTIKEHWLETAALTWRDVAVHTPCWWRGTVARTSILAGELSLSHARPSADGWPLMWVNRPLEVSQPGQLSLSSSRGR